MCAAVRTIREFSPLFAVLAIYEVLHLLTPILAPDTVDGALLKIDHAVLGPIHQPRPAPQFDGEEQPTAAWAPTLGQHTDDILTEAGWSPTDIADLRADSVVA